MPQFSELRKLDFVHYKVKKYPLSYEGHNLLRNELDMFCSNPDYHNGEFIEISIRNKDIAVRPSDLLINNISESETKDLIKKLFIGDGKHITKMKEKSEEFDNFFGYLHFTIPFDKEISKKNIENCF